VRTSRRSNRHRDRTGFTLIEILIVITIIGILLGLTIPAIQRSRESGRRLQCMNNLRQIGIAIQAFQTVHGFFPPAWPSESEKGGVVIRSLYSPQLQILSFLDQDTVTRSINFTLSSDPGDAPQNLTAQDTHIAVFICPSEISPLLRGPTGPSSYRANIGPSPYYWDSTQRYPGGGGGAFPVSYVIRPANFTDGLSQTAFLSEKLMGDDQDRIFTPKRDYWCAGLPDSSNYPAVDELIAICQSTPPGIPQYVSRGGHTWYVGSFDSTWYNHSIPPNSSVAGCKVNDAIPTPEQSGLFGGIFGASSSHDGGVNCLFGDGSGRFIKDTVNIQVWRALSTRAKQEVIPDSGF
jgi:prepilin-type N-terminal cleavage/methylation domain-containing protein/prepilin-type processing-associated H-X9-DG protein